MTLNEIKKIVNDAYEKKSIYIAGDGNVFSHLGGSAAAATLGALVETIEDRRFNVYCENQKKLTGWVASRGNPILKLAREALKDSGAAPAIDHAWNEFIGPLVNEHVRLGGDPPHQDETRALCAVFATKVIWDKESGLDTINPENCCIDVGERAELGL